jgi:hypothetical protein
MPKDKSLKRKGDRGQNIIDFKEEDIRNQLSREKKRTNH